MYEPIVKLEGVAKRFGSHEVLKDLSFSVPKGSVFAFLGNNGQGKSSTIRLMTGLLRADRGEIRIAGLDINKQRKSILAHIGCLVDSPSLYPNLTAHEFLQISCRLKGLPSKDINRALELVDLRFSGKKRVADFSLGMKQRLALAHALMGQPRLLILDEPMNGLDPDGILSIRNLLKSLPESAQCTVFLSSHQLSEVEKVASHLAVLKDGHIAFQGEMKSLMQAQRGMLSLDVDDVDRSIAVLTQKGFETRRHSSHEVHVHNLAKTQASSVNALVVHAGISLYQSRHSVSSLEDWFLQATGDMKNGETK